VLAGDEGRHASRVARVRVNDRVAVFDGCGREWIGRVEGVDRSEVAIVVDQTRTVERPADGVTILQAWLLRDKPIEELVRRATEIGVCGITFYPAARSEREVKVKDKLRKVAIEACKQCGRVWLPEFRVADSLAQALERAAERRLLLTGAYDPRPWREAVGDGPCAVAVGPEGDFTEAELGLALERGTAPVSLGPYTYRSEIAGVLAATLIQYERGALGPC